MYSYLSRPLKNGLASVLFQHRPLIYQIFSHPFNQGLFTGTLPSDVFKRYLVADIRYLHRLGIYACKFSEYHQCSMMKDVQMMAGTELDMHQQVGHLLCGMSENVEENHALSLYLAHLESYLLPPNPEHMRNHRSFDRHFHWLKGAAAVFPCFWTYARLPFHYNFSQNTERHNPYLFWIKTYQQKHFIALNQRLWLEINGKMRYLPVQEKQIISGIIGEGLQCELDFYQAAMHENTPALQL